MPHFVRAVIGISALTLCAAKCSGPQEEFLAVQVCLSDEAESKQLVGILRETASLEGLRFVDASSTTESYLADVRGKGLIKLDHVPTVYVGIEGPHGLGATASNLGLPSNQIALGFTAGNDAAKAHRLADRLVQALQRRWRVETLAKGQGSFPMKSCPSAQTLG